MQVRKQTMSKNPAKDPARGQAARSAPLAVQERSADKALLCALERRLLRLERGLRKTLDERAEVKPGDGPAGKG